MRSDAARGHQIAVGSPTHESWLRIGQMQFDFLVTHGLESHMRILEIGCGGLRAGRLFIDYLDPGNYFGVDISPDILLAAQRTIVEYGLQAKSPNLALVDDMGLEFLPAAHFDVVHAHSVLPHCTIAEIEECMAGVRRVLRPGGFFDFTFSRANGAERNILNEDFYYRVETLAAIAGEHGFTAQLLEDWEALPHRQSKLRVIAAA